MAGLRPHRRLSALLLVALLSPALAGCIAATEDPLSAGTAPEGAPRREYAAVDESNLSQPTFGVLPAIDTRIAASTDGIALFAEVYLPDGEGPWPTILHSTPYKHLDKALEVPFGNRLVDFYVPRGYAVVLADVRGFGDSDGCVEVWGPNEQQDQYDLVEWVAEQAWSDGKVGMIGASYPGTTPIEAAVMAPPHLVTIVAAAGLTDPYFDWHYGGVPTGESGPVGSPAAYQAIGAAPPIEPVPDPESWMLSAANAGCGTSQLMLEAWQQDSVYTEFYAERNFSARVKDIQASVLFTQGFMDGNVKPAQLLHFFNEIEAPKKGFFGQWGHQFPVREDYRTYELAWFDHWLKGLDTGAMGGPVVEVLTNEDTWRGDDAFPSAWTTPERFHLDATDMRLVLEAPETAGEASFVADRSPRLVGGPLSIADDAARGRSAEDERLVFASAPLEEDLYLSGVVELPFRATMDAENAYLMASLYEVDGGQRTRIAFGGLAAALRDGYHEYKPVPTGEPVDYTLRFQPREYVVPKGASLELVLYTVDVLDATTTEAMGPATVTLHTGPDVPSALVVPALEGRPDVPLPWDE